MSNLERAYEWKEERTTQNLKFIFISKGAKDVIKVVQYSYVQELDGRSIYNLEFGDYDLDTDIITDQVITNNDDVYKVFMSVLKTIPVFFEQYSKCMLMVQGSDGRQDFSDQCKLTCSKRCGNICKKYNRRINIYRNYIDKHFDELCVDYQFLGGRNQGRRTIVMEIYKCGEAYDAIFLLKKT